MDEKDFKKHLRDLAHGHHHPAEHDWSGPDNVVKTAQPHPARARAKSSARKRTRK